MHNAVILPVRATRCRYRPRALVWVRLAWPGSAAQGKPRRRQARQAVALRRPGKARKVSPGFEKYCIWSSGYSIWYMMLFSTNNRNRWIEVACVIRLTFSCSSYSISIFHYNLTVGNHIPKMATSTVKYTTTPSLKMYICLFHQGMSSWQMLTQIALDLLGPICSDVTYIPTATIELLLMSPWQAIWLQQHGSTVHYAPVCPCSAITTGPS